MKCPKCKENLSITSQERLETLGEHVCDPNGTPSLKNLWQCTNSKCQCFIAFGWDDSGDFYALDYSHKTREVFPTGEYSAIGSIARQLDVEVYRKGLPEKKYLHPILMLYFFQPFIEWHGTADKDGNILKKWWTLGILKKPTRFGKQSNLESRYCLHAEFCWNTWAYLWKIFKMEYNRGDFNRAFKPSMNKAWVYRWFHTFIKILYYDKQKRTLRTGQQIPR